MAYTNSPLADYTIKSPYHSGKRTHKIDRITPHCYVGQVTAERGGNGFKSRPAGSQASCNYVVGTDGKVCLVVDEENVSWCSSSDANDNRAITIECASDSTHPYAFNDACYNKLIDLCVDICKRNGINKVLWINDKNKALAYAPKDGECVLTVHRWFKAKACPGDWMYSRMGQFADAINAKIAAPAPQPAPAPAPVENKTYCGKGVGTATAKDNMSIRSGAGINYSKYGSISIGTKVEVLEVLSNGWYKIVWPGASVGYAYTSNEGGGYYSYVANKAPAPTPAPASTVKKVVASGKPQYKNTSFSGTYKTTANLNMRQDAGTKYPIMVTIPQNTTIKCYGYYSTYAGGKWYYVVYTKGNTEYTGFCASGYFKKV